MSYYANIIIDITNQKLDRTFQYKIPDSLKEKVTVGCQVIVPFGRGNRQIRGFVVDITAKPEFDESLLKEILEVKMTNADTEGVLIKLSYWMKVNYGSTMIQALKTVFPIKDKVRSVSNRFLTLNIEKEQANNLLSECLSKKYTAKARLLEALINDKIVPYNIAIDKLNISSATIKAMIEKQTISLISENVYRNPVKLNQNIKSKIPLNNSQKFIVNTINEGYLKGRRDTYLIHGVTGSGKTEVYMELISNMIGLGKQCIVLIPEIALTYQNVIRFYTRFGDRVSIVNSKLSAGEKYDQFERAKKGEIDVMIGPRSALFTPFPNLGLIVIDEEHEDTYKSETSPKYHARETAIERAKLSDGIVVLGSATPSVESYYKALKGEYVLFKLKDRAVANSTLPGIYIADLRDEMAKGNRTIFSDLLKQLIIDRLNKDEQIMLFLNRRGHTNFISCRLCGEVIKCPHCDVSLTLHKGFSDRLVCHYCGYEIPLPKECPNCGSKYIAGFGMGTQKVEESVKLMFPKARTLRMDFDTTSKKGGHEAILSTFANHEADILIGTQMIVKGHDFKAVTLVGILAADLSLYAGDYRASEKTFQLLTQAAGRAGRGEKKGEVVIQTYNPEHYSIVCAGRQDYESFYEREIMYRSLLMYPPIFHMMTVMMFSKNEIIVNKFINLYATGIKRDFKDVIFIGPVDAPVFKVNDVYRKMFYAKSENYKILIAIKDCLENWEKRDNVNKEWLIQFDFA